MFMNGTNIKILRVDLPPYTIGARHWAVMLPPQLTTKLAKLELMDGDGSGNNRLPLHAIWRET